MRLNRAYLNLSPFFACAMRLHYPTVPSLTYTSKVFFLSLIARIRDLGIQIFMPLSMSMAFWVSCRMRTLAQVYFSFWNRILRIVNGQSIRF